MCLALLVLGPDLLGILEGFQSLMTVRDALGSFVAVSAILFASLPLPRLMPASFVVDFLAIVFGVFLAVFLEAGRFVGRFIGLTDAAGEYGFRDDGWGSSMVTFSSPSVYSQLFL